MKFQDKLSELTVWEKGALCCSTDCISFPGVPRLGIPPVKGIDGPQGVRLEDGRNTTALPCNMALAASFDRELAFEYGKILALECIDNGFQIIFGPGLNLMRTPMNGRNFEYMGEDPVLAGKIGAAYVSGSQSEGVAACPKHLALNNQEICRTTGSSNCDWDVIRNLYLEAFRIIVKEAKPWTIMSSYNKINGEFASQCGTLQQKILKDEWGFDGVVISDAGAVHDGKAAYLNGLDIALADLYYKELIPALVEKGELDEKLLDEKVSRMLLLTERTANAAVKECNYALHAEFARKAAASGMVLLKNRNGILPLNSDKVKKILVTGPAAESFHCIGTLERQGGSGAVHPAYEITPLAGVKEELEGFEIDYMPCFKFRADQFVPENILEMDIRYFDRQTNELIYEEKSSKSSLNYGHVNAGGVFDDHFMSGKTFRAEISGRIKAEHDMKGQFAVFDSRLDAVLEYNSCRVTCQSQDIPLTELKAGEELHFTVKFDFAHVRFVELTLLWLEETSELTRNIISAAAQYDAVLYFGGRTHIQDKEAIGAGDVPGADIGQWELADNQDEFLKNLCAVNKNVIGVFNTGSPFDMRSWHEDIGAVLIAWYAGMENGRAIADILSGKAEPAGRLPFTWGRDIMDYSCHANGCYPGVRTGDDPHTDYLEGEFIGYRHFDRTQKEIFHPFGFGLGYGKFTVGKMEICREKGIKIRVPLKNDSELSGSEVIHLYALREKESRRPLKELAEFTKVFAAPQESVTAEIILSDEEIGCLRDNGFVKLAIGRNAAELFEEMEL